MKKKLAKEIVVSMTRSDITRGECCNAHQCAIAVAIKRRFAHEKPPEALQVQDG